MFYGRGVKLKCVDFQGILGQFFSFTPYVRVKDKKLKNLDIDKNMKLMYFTGNDVREVLLWMLG